ncbi:TPA: hypothetical protein HA253_07135 [Candidatus Woesearchaeota archaeon]|nr:hypothetical protein [Candidatus Woesearchaeota archaeon]
MAGSEDDAVSRFQRRREGEMPQSSGQPLQTRAEPPSEFDYGLRRLLKLYELEVTDARIALADDMDDQITEAGTTLRPLNIPFVPIRLQGQGARLEQVVAEARRHHALVLLIDHNFSGGNGVQYAKDIFRDCEGCEPELYLRPVVYSVVDQATKNPELQRLFPHLDFISKRDDPEKIRVAVQRAYVDAVLWRDQLKQASNLRKAYVFLRDDNVRLKAELEKAGISMGEVRRYTAEELDLTQRPAPSAPSEYRTPQLAEELMNHLVGNVIYLDDTRARPLAKSRMTASWSEELRLVDVHPAYRLFEGNNPTRDISRPFAGFLNDLETQVENHAREQAVRNRKQRPRIETPTVRQYSLHFASGDTSESVFKRGKETDLDLTLTLTVPSDVYATHTTVEMGFLRFFEYLSHVLNGQAKARSYAGQGEATGYTAIEIQARFPGVYEPTTQVEVVQTALPRTTATNQRDVLGRVSLRRVPVTSYIAPPPRTEEAR